MNPNFSATQKLTSIFHTKVGSFDCFNFFKSTKKMLLSYFESGELDIFHQLLDKNLHKVDPKILFDVKSKDTLGDNIEKPDKLSLAILCIIYCKKSDLLKKLLDDFKGEIDLNHQTNGKLSALYMACSYDKWDMAEVILNYEIENPNSVDVNLKSGFTAFHCACEKGKIKFVKLFLACLGLKANSTLNDGGYAPLHYAASNNHFSIVELLIADSRVDFCKGSAEGSIFKIAHDKSGVDAPPCELEVMLDKYFEDNYSVGFNPTHTVFEDEISIPTIPPEFDFFHDILKKIPTLNKCVFKNYYDTEDDKKMKVYIAHFLGGQIFIEVYEAQFYLDYLKNTFFPEVIFSRKPLSGVLDFSDPDFINKSYILTTATVRSLFHLLNGK